MVEVRSCTRPPVSPPRQCDAFLLLYALYPGAWIYGLAHVALGSVGTERCGKVVEILEGCATRRQTAPFHRYRLLLLLHMEPKILLLVGEEALLAEQRTRSNHGRGSRGLGGKEEG